MRHFAVVLALLAVVCVACDEKDPEAQAQIYLNESRVLLLARQYDAARDTIMSLRKQFPTSLKTRAQAILVLDSIEFMAAEDSLDFVTGAAVEELRLRAEFYRRKLQEDSAR